MLPGIKLLLMLILQLARVYKSLVCFTLYSNDKKMSIVFIKISHYWELLFFASKNAEFGVFGVIRRRLVGQ